MLILNFFRRRVKKVLQTARIALPPDMDAETANMIRHQINEALNALLNASILDYNVRAILD